MRRRDYQKSRNRRKHNPLSIADRKINRRAFPDNIEGIKDEDIQEKDIRQEHPDDVQRKHQRRGITDEVLPQLQVLLETKPTLPYFVYDIRRHIITATGRDAGNYRRLQCLLENEFLMREKAQKGGDSQEADERIEILRLEWVIRLCVPKLCLFSLLSH